MSAVPFALIDDADAVAGDLVSTDLFSAICTNLNTLMVSIPVGTIMPVLSGISGIPEPDTNVWELCDGHPVSNQASPIRNRNTPDLTTPGAGGPESPFLKGALSIGQAGNGNGPENYGGAHYPPWLAHSHTGGTGDYAAPQSISNGNTWFTWVTDHVHGITSDLAGSQVLPVNITIKCYIKVI